MHYKNTFINQNLRIKVHTNSERIHRLIENVLDFNNACDAGPKIKISFFLDELNPKRPTDGSDFLWRSKLNKGNILLSSLFLGSRIANVISDPGAGVIRGTVSDFKESSKENILDFVLMQPLRFILAHHGLFFLHASAVSKNKDCMLICGPQNSGKSTLALVLAQNGFNLLADDDCFVKLVRGQTQLFPFPTKIGLNEKTLKIYPELAKYTLKNYRYGGKRRISLNSISDPNHTKGLKCRMIIFPKYQVKRSIYMKEIPKEEALNRLAKESPVAHIKEGFQKMFWTLYSLTRNANSFELIYNDERLDEIPEIINKNF